MESGLVASEHAGQTAKPCGIGGRLIETERSKLTEKVSFHGRVPTIQILDGFAAGDVFHPSKSMNAFAAGKSHCGDEQAQPA